MMGIAPQHRTFTIPPHLNMKRNLILLTFTFLSCFIPASRANLIYSGTDIIIPLDLAGVYLNLSTGATALSQPADWNTAPWINPFFGGVYVASSPLLLPVITGTDRILNLAAGTVIGAAGTFAPGESGSSTHVGPAADQFQIGVPGIMGFKFLMTPGGAVHYGWLGMVVNNTGAGTITEWAYESTPDTAVLAGSTTPVPEPAVVAVGLLCLAVGLARRRQGERAG